MYVSLFLAMAIGQPAQRFPSYEAGAAIATTAGRHLVTFVGITPRHVQGVTVARASGLDGLPTKCVVVSRPTKGGHEWLATLPVDATDSQIRIAAGIEVSRSATPFTTARPDVKVGVSVEALDEVNAERARRGLPPFLRDDGLTAAAKAAAAYRAANRISGHYRDFSFLPEGSHATAAGCAAWPDGWGWGSCCTYERWAFAGAAWCIGSDGQRYMHLFVR